MNSVRHPDEITDARRVGTSTNVLIEISEEGCPHRYLLYGVRDGTARSWAVGDCHAPVRIASAGDRELFLFYTQGYRHVFEYRDHRVFEAIDRYSSRPAPLSPAIPAEAPAHYRCLRKEQPRALHRRRHRRPRRSSPCQAGCRPRPRRWNSRRRRGQPVVIDILEWARK